MNSLRIPVDDEAEPEVTWQALGTEKPDGFTFDFKSDRLVLDEKSPANKPSEGGFGNTVQLPNGRRVSVYTYRGEDGNVHAEVLRWALP